MSGIPWAVASLAPNKETPRCFDRDLAMESLASGIPVRLVARTSTELGHRVESPDPPVVKSAA